MLPVHEIVVKFNDFRLKSEHTALQGKTERGGCLSARRRACNEDNLHLSTLFINPVSDGGIIPLVLGLGKIDQPRCIAVENRLVQGPDSIDPDD